MATFEYVEIPPDAVRLKSSSLEPAAKITTSLPDSSPPRALSELVSPARSALALVPQMLLSTSIPPNTAASVVASAIATATPRTQSHSLLSTRDPLSVPIMTVNFRRFVSKVGPVFWLQDRIEEIILWKKGWKRTAVWLAAYGFFCYFPRMTLLIPHIALLGVMLHCYPGPGAPPVQMNVGEGAADWQANIQAIQNLMGAVSDAHDAIIPLLPLLVPSQAYAPPRSHSRFPSTASYEPTPNPTPKPSRRAADVPNPTIQSATRPHHPLLIATLLSFFVLLLALVADILPLRLLFFVAGAGTVCALHPWARDLVSGTVFTALSGSGPGLSFRLTITVPCLPRFRSLLSLLPIALRRVSHASTSQMPAPRTHTFALTIAPRDAYLFFRRLMDDDRLDDAAWRAPLSHVELWENERWVQDTTETKRRKSVVMLVREGRETEEDSRDDDGLSTTSTISSGTVTGLADGGKEGAVTRGTWSKANLKPNERVGWTRGRDGWSGVGGEVSSNLTFSLSPGWAFVETEGWRPDLSASWAVDGVAPCSSVCVGADEDGWAYTTDTWTHTRPDGRPSDGWVTRRRRWVRRVYFKGGEE